jgi:hypothetical protein
MPIILAENAVSQVLAYLEANLNTKVSAIAADYANPPYVPLTLDPIQSWHISEQQYGSDQCPSISVLPVQTNDEQIDNPAYFGSANPIVVQVMDTYQDRDTLTRRLMRYCRAVFLCIRDMQQNAVLSPSIITYSGTIVDYSPQWTAGDKAHIWQDAHCVFMVALREYA